jgi:hypothetical protein
MNDQVFYTVISGTMVFVFGQMLQRFILEPIQSYKKTVGRIDNKLKFYSNILTNTGFDNDFLAKITDIIRNLSCEIESKYKQIPFNWLFSKLKVIETKKDLAKVAQDLIFLSNAGGRNGSKIEKCDERIKEIRRLLKIESLG